jgi:pilus assembly protein CpaB
MRNKRLVFVLAGALVFGLLAAASVSKYLSSAQAFAGDLDKAVVAKVDIPVGQKIVAEQLSVVQFPHGSTPDGTFSTTDKLIGRVAVVNIAAREAITDSKLAAEGTAGGLSAVIPEGYRAMTVKVDEVVGISGFIQPGTLVDVVVVIDPTGVGVNGSNPISKIVLQNIKVLANGQNIDKPKDDREANAVRAVTLQVTPEQAEKLALASTEGKLQLVMRNSGDQDDATTTGVDKKSLLNGSRATPVPEPGALKSEQPKTETKPVRPVIRSEKPKAQAQPQANQQPSAPRASVEMIEGAKKRSVDFP